MHLITGYSGTAHITSANDGAVNAHVFGNGSYVFDSRNKFSAEIVSNNVININAGEGLFNGRYFEIVSGSHDVANIDNGSSGTNRIDLIVARYTKNSETGVEAMAITVIKGTAASSPVAPSYNTGNILDGVGIADFPLYKVYIEGLTIKTVTALFTIRKDIVTDVKENNANTIESIQNAIRTSGQYSIEEITFTVGAGKLYTLENPISDYEFYEIITSYGTSGIVPTSENAKIVYFDSLYRSSNKTVQMDFHNATTFWQTDRTSLYFKSDHVMRCATYTGTTTKTVTSEEIDWRQETENVTPITHIYGFKLIAQE